MRYETRSRSRSRPAVALAALAWLLLKADSPAARERPHFEAAAGHGVAAAAAAAWAPDAALVYVENDEDVNESGGAERWGYLFHSGALRAARAYCVRDGRILAAENLAMKYEAPPLPAGWIDSGAALRAAEDGGGREFRRRFRGAVRWMLLSRGAFQDRDPDRTTWTVIYDAPRSPSLFVMVDAVEGKVRRTWKG